MRCGWRVVRFGSSVQGFDLETQRNAAQNSSFGAPLHPVNAQHQVPTLNIQKSLRVCAGV